LLTLMSAVSWAIGNVLVKRLPAVEMLELMVWLSVVPPLPSLALSLALDGPAALARMPGRGWLGWGAATYLGVIATVLAYAIWGNLLRRYPATMVTPFALLVPFVAAYASSVVFGEQFGALRLAGMASVLLGLAIIVLPVGPRLRHLATNAAENASIVPATRADTEGVIALIGRVYAEYGFIYDPPTEVPDLLRFEAHYEPPRGAFFVVRHGNEVVGSVGVERVDRDTAELHRLYLDADLRGGGTGRALVEAAVGWCRAQSVSRLFLWSDTRFERAHRLYARMGFRQRGERTLRDVNRTREYCFERKL
jgi:GNAT superfamily N-acetyltransferase